MHNDPRYTDINDPTRVYPRLTRDEAHEFALKLLRQFGSPTDAAVRDDGLGGSRYATRADLMGIYSRWTAGGKTGRRCWASSKPSTGHRAGWGRLIHDVSHMVHRYRHPKARPHGPGHDAIERDVLTVVLVQGWLAPKIAVRQPTTDEKRSAKLASVLAGIERWERKEKRAANALKKLRARKRRLEKGATCSP